MECIVCASTDMQPIPFPYQHSMTTAGKRVEEPLAKSQCMSCGAIQRTQIRMLGETDFYETSYDFYSRPGASLYDMPRYEAMARWIRDSVQGWQPERILDAGCGRGWMLKAVRNVFPLSFLHGIEPSGRDSAHAIASGLEVQEGRVDRNWKSRSTYDLIYSVNVLEHTVDPPEFLKVLSNALAPGGIMVIICPDSSCPSAEFMFSDQNYSFTAPGLLQLVNRQGLQTYAWRQPPELSSLKEKQLVVCGRENSPPVPWRSDSLPICDVHALYRERVRYVEKYEECDAYLSEAVRGSSTVVSFGTSTWAWLIAAYCPKYWKRVNYCVIDGSCGEFMGKPVRAYADMKRMEGLSVVTCVSPHVQAQLRKRIEGDGFECVTWSHLIQA